MMFNRLSLRALIFTLWFAVLQAFAPFMHAHFGDDSQAVDHGPHLHLAKTVEANVIRVEAGTPLSDETASSASAFDWHADISSPEGHILDLDPAIASKKLALNKPDSSKTSISNGSVSYDAPYTHVLALNVVCALLVCLLLARTCFSFKRSQHTSAYPAFFITHYALRAPPAA